MLSQINVKRIELALIVFLPQQLGTQKWKKIYICEIVCEMPKDKWILKQLEKMEIAIVVERDKLINDH